MSHTANFKLTSVEGDSNDSIRCLYFRDEIAESGIKFVIENNTIKHIHLLLDTQKFNSGIDIIIDDLTHKVKGLEGID